VVGERERLAGRLAERHALLPGEVGYLGRVGDGSHDPIMPDARGHRRAPGSS
jgi:hypothetical protein